VVSPESVVLAAGNCKGLIQHEVLNHRPRKASALNALSVVRAVFPCSDVER
jgi:hypothetical protein